MAVAEVERPTLRVTNIPHTITATDLLRFLESHLGPGSVFAVDIVTDHRNWKSRGYGRVQFSSLELKSKAQRLADSLTFNSRTLDLSQAYDDVIPRPHLPHHRLERSVVHVGFLVEADHLCELERWSDVRAWVMPERRRVEFWLWRDLCWKYKVDVLFEDVLECVGCCLGGDKLNSLLIKYKHGPRIYERISGPNVASKFKPNRYHICKEDFDFLWIRTTDFSPVKSLGQSNTFCLEIEDGLSAQEIFANFPFYIEQMMELNIDDGSDFHSSSKMVPLVEPDEENNLDYEVVFQLNSLVHTQKISLSAAYELTDTLSGVDVDTVLSILQKLHQLKVTCFNPVTFAKTHLHIMDKSRKRPRSVGKLTGRSIVSCHRALVTPTKIYCLGPELESSNYVVKHFAEYASDFMRVTFVEEDWGKLLPTAVSISVRKGIYGKPFRTAVYRRILNALKEGIVIVGKKFEFLAFSASQLRSNSVWMFASNDKIKAEEIREWMGCFKKIRSVSKCAARMGQLFSSSYQTLPVPAEEVEIIPDVEVNNDGVNHCFSDGIGKISLDFARQVARKCGLNDTPSAFQIRYGGYKGVIAVDPHSTRKLSLRKSMLKFESDNIMLNVTTWNNAMPCYLNREIISLLSTLGVEDDALLLMQKDQLALLSGMLTNRDAALRVLESLSGMDKGNILVKMLGIGYDPSAEPYLSMMLRVHHGCQLADLRSRCRIHVPKGRILIGCLDESGILEYGQVYVRITLSEEERDQIDWNSFKKVDETSSVVVGKVVVTKNPCLHPGDIRVLEAVYRVELQEKGLTDCLVFPQKGERPHPNECSGGDLDGDQFFVCWDEGLIPTQVETPMDYTARRPRIMDHNVTLEEIHKFFVDYMINDTLGAISTAHLVHADREPGKARSEKCLQLATLHSMAVDFAKTGAPAEMPRILKPREYPEFMERYDKPMYTSSGVLGKLYRAILDSKPESPILSQSLQIAEESYDDELEIDGFRDFLDAAEKHRDMYREKMMVLMNFYGAQSEEEILTGNLRNRASYLLRDNRKFGDMKDRIMISLKSLQLEAKGWFENSCKVVGEKEGLASAWYHVTYHPSFGRREFNLLSFPWIVGDILLDIKSKNKGRCSIEKGASSDTKMVDGEHCSSGS